MYKLVAIFGPYLVKLLVVGGGLALLGYLAVRLRLRPFVLLLCSFLLYAPLTKKLSIGFGPGLNPTTFLLAALALLWFARPIRSPVRSPLKALLVIWMLVNCASALATGLNEPGPYFDANLRLLKRMIDPILLFFFTLTVREEKERLGLIVSLCAGAFLVGFHAYVQGITQSGRIRGLLDHPNLTMAFLSALAPFLLATAMGARTTRWRIATFFSLYIVLMGLFETGSRMGLLASAMACLAVLLISGNRLFAALGVAAAVVLIVSPQLMPERLYKRFQGMLGSADQYSSTILLDETNPDSHVGLRFAIWKGGVDIIRKNPLAGTGFGTFNREIAHYLVDFYGEDRQRSAHNAYIKTAAELGIPALLLLLLIFYQALKQAWLVFATSSDPQVEWLARGAFGMTLSLLMSNMTTASFQDTEIMAYFYTVTAVICVLRHQANSDQESVANTT